MIKNKHLISYKSQFEIFAHTKNKKLNRLATIEVLPHCSDPKLQSEVIKDMHSSLNDLLFEYGSLNGKPFVLPQDIKSDETAEYSEKLLFKVSKENSSKSYQLTNVSNSLSQKKIKKIEENILNDSSFKATCVKTICANSTIEAHFELVRYSGPSGLVSLATIKASSPLSSLQERFDIISELYFLIEFGLDIKGDVANLPFSCHNHAIPDQSSTFLPRLLLTTTDNGKQETITLDGSIAPDDKLALEYEYLVAQGLKSKVLTP